MARLSYAETTRIMNIVRNFDVADGDIDIIESFGGGRINRTYKITIRCKEKRFEYLLQNVNHFVFPDTKGLMQNLTSVTQYIQSNGERALNFIKCKEDVKANNKNGDYIYIDSSYSREHWRMYHYIDADVYPCIINPHHAYMLGGAIAKFSTSLDGFDAGKLVETIPDFHNTPKRFETLLYSVASDTVNHKNRVRGVEDDVKFVMSRCNRLDVLMNALNNGEIPLRVAHNDPKLSNVLFDKEKNEPICMIDLDTIMPGTGLFDVGDAIRSIANTASEDDKTTENVSFSIELFEEFIKGYIKGMGNKLTRREMELIPDAVWVIAMELGIRFLTDHIDGNIYFKTDYDGQNIERAKIQFVLAECIEAVAPELRSIVKETSENFLRE